jgi:hypothetical protein
MRFVSANYSPLLDEADILMRNYQDTIKEISRRLNVDMSATTGPNGFLSDPQTASIKTIFDPLFDLIRGKININTFEERANNGLSIFFETAFQFGYEQFSVLSLMRLLEADEIKASPKDDIPWKSLRSAAVQGYTENNKSDQPVAIPPLKRMDKILYERPRATSLTTPDFIFHSKRLKLNVAVGFGCYESVYNAEAVSPKREWLPAQSILPLNSSAILIYIDVNPYDISLMADTKRICRPDLILECRGGMGWYEKEGPEQIRHHFDVLKPRLGTYIISRDSVPEPVLKELVTETDLEAYISGKISTSAKTEQIASEVVAESKQKTSLAPESLIQEPGIHILPDAFDQPEFKPVIDVLLQLKKVNIYPLTGSQKNRSFKNELMLIFNAIFKLKKSPGITSSACSNKKGYISQSKK